MIDLHTATIVMRYYVGEDDSERDGLLEVETNEGEVDLIVQPRTESSLTYSLSAEEAWRLSRELAKAATVVELGLSE